MPVRCFLHMIRSSLVAVFLVTTASAQDLDELSTLAPESLAAMKEEKWEEALKLLTQATSMNLESAVGERMRGANGIK